MMRVLVILVLFVPKTAFAAKMIVPIQSREAEVCAEWLTRTSTLTEGKTTTVKAEIVEADDTYIRSETGLAIVLGEEMSPSHSGAHLIYYLPVSREELAEVRGGIETIDNASIQRTAVPGMLYSGFRAGLLLEFRKGEVDLHIDVSSERGTNFYTFTFSNVKPF